jgi:hypothetical protein
VGVPTGELVRAAWKAALPAGLSLAASNTADELVRAAWKAALPAAALALAAIILALQPIRAGTTTGATSEACSRMWHKKEERRNAMSLSSEPAPPPQGDAPQPPEAGQPAQRQTRRGLIGGAAAISIVVFLFAGLFFAFSHLAPSPASAAPTPTFPTDWQRYTDPGGYFSVSIPKGWSVQRDTSEEATMGNRQGSVTVHPVMDVLGGPPRGQQTISVWIHITPIINDLERQMMCEGFSSAQQNTTVAGLPAWHDDLIGWIVTSNSASFQINYQYPNWKGDVAMPANAPTATPMPPGFYDQGQREIQMIISSFMPLPDTPLACK